ncbi:hypothetical protein [Tautonia plasticadhaerens]|uniref:Uncharacterized protein n=1 Tax=Tautonia plasticadhaerens TaxID=2527974 RepID=A0A518H4J5_9BACT|nr:hypothetical protein [Tautonia plasticadhaerens]QDV35762.1 hypothetical protein ElP_36680 [Tautonia plasticadhaerens]
MDDANMIPIVAILMPLFLVPTVMVLRQASRKREWQHRERMKAMEMGLPAPGAEAWSGRAAIAIGAAMPVAVFVVGWFANMTTHNDDVWVPVALVGGAGVLGGLRLAGKNIGSMIRPTPRPQPRPSAFARGTAKPPFDPDAYDAIARHG